MLNKNYILLKMKKDLLKISYFEHKVLHLFEEEVFYKQIMYQHSKTRKPLLYFVDAKKNPLKTQSPNRDRER